MASMSVGIVILAVVALAAMVALLYRVLASAEQREDRLFSELRQAQERLLYARTEEKAEIPAPEIPFVDPVMETPLVPQLLDFLAQYTDEAVRTKYERMIRAGLAKQLSPLAILKQFEQNRLSFAE